MSGEDLAQAGLQEDPITGPVYIVASDPDRREALAGALGEAGADAQAFASLAEFLKQSRVLPPGCVVSGLCIDTTDSGRLLREIAEQGCPFSVVVLAPAGDMAAAVRAMKAGAEDVVALPVRPAELARAVRAALAARSRADGQGEAAGAVRLRLARLTRRERQVLDAMVRGDGNKAIAHELGISPRTVEVHRAKVMEKLACRSLPDVVRLAVQAGMLRT